MDAPKQRGPRSVQIARKNARELEKEKSRKERGTRKADVVYIWGLAHRKGFYKIGVTTSRNPMERIRKVANQKGWTKDPIVIMILRTGEPYALEAKLKKIGRCRKDYFPMSFDGRTEIRELSDQELQKAVSVSYEHAIKNKVDTVVATVSDPSNHPDSLKAA